MCIGSLKLTSKRKPSEFWTKNIGLLKNISLIGLVAKFSGAIVILKVSTIVNYDDFEMAVDKDLVLLRTTVS